MATVPPRTMIAFDVPGGRFTARVAGVCIHHGHVLLQSVEDTDFWFLPGGRCEIGETTQESLCREMREEIHVDVRVERLLWIVENFFELEAQRFHEIGLYYTIELPEPLPPHLGLGSTHRTIDGDMPVFFRWFSLGALPRGSRSIFWVFGCGPQARSSGPSSGPPRFSTTVATLPWSSTSSRT